MDDLKAHGASSHMVEYGKSAGHLVEERTIHVLA